LSLWRVERRRRRAGLYPLRDPHRHGENGHARDPAWAETEALVGRITLHEADERVRAKEQAASAKAKHD
jgi:hypothetical protein